jgi:hypothetical protein
VGSGRELRQLLGRRAVGRNDQGIEALVDRIRDVDDRLPVKLVLVLLDGFARVVVMSPPPAAPRRSAATASALFSSLPTTVR